MMTRPFLSFLLFSLIASTLFSALHAQSRVDISKVSITSITSDGSCVDQFPFALNCSLPSTLTLTLSGIPSSAPPFTFLEVLIDGGDAETYFIAASLPNQTSTVQGELRLGGYSVGLMGRLLTVTLYDFSTGNRSQPFNGLSLIPLPPPVITSIGGCEGSGQSTLNCLPDRDVLTFQGTGLSIFRELLSFIITIGESSGSVDVANGVQVLSDSVMLVPLNSSYSNYVQASHFTGVKLSISFNLEWWSTASGRFYQYPVNALSISFAPLPPPSITSYNAPGSTASITCQMTNSSTFVACVPHRSRIQFYGDYLYSATVSLSAPGKGSFPCETGFVQGTGTAAVCFLPLIPTDTDGQAWDVTVSTASGSLSYPGLVTFSTSTLLTSMVACNTFAQQTGGDLTVMNCPPGSTFTMRGQRFTPDPALSIQLVSNNNPMYSIYNVSCWSPKVVDSTTLTCIIPVIDPSLSSNFYGTTSSVQAMFPTKGVTTNYLQNYIVAFPDSPVLTSVEGCGVSNGSLTVSQCRAGDVLTVTGMRLNGTGLALRFIVQAQILNVYECTILDGWSDTQLQCRLPYVTPDNSVVQADTLYRMTWSQVIPNSAVRTSPGRKYGNPITLAFTWEPRPSSSSSSSSFTAILAGVLVPVLVGLVVAVGVWRWRVMRGYKPDSPRSREGEGRERESSAIQLEGGSSEVEVVE